MYGQADAVAVGRVRVEDAADDAVEIELMAVAELEEALDDPGVVETPEVEDAVREVDMYETGFTTAPATRTAALVPEALPTVPPACLT